MIKISKQDVAYLAKLSNISLDDKQSQRLKNDLESIIHYFKLLSTVNTDEVEPTYEINGLKNVWRQDDLIDEMVSGSALLAITPNVNESLIKVPKVL